MLILLSSGKKETTKYCGISRVIFDKQVTEYTFVRNYNSSITTQNFKLSYTCD